VRVSPPRGPRVSNARDRVGERSSADHTAFWPFFCPPSWLGCGLPVTDPRSPHAYRDEATDGEPDTALLVYDSEEETRRSRGGAWLLIAIALVPVAYGLVGIGQSTRLAESVGSASIVVFGVLSLLVFYQWRRRTEERRLRVEFSPSCGRRTASG